MREPRTIRRWTVWLVAGLGFFAIFAGWAIGSPFNGTYDEDDHVIRAAGVALGQIHVSAVHAIYNGGGFQRVPASLKWPHSDCIIVQTPRPPATCEGVPSKNHDLVRTASAAARYNPLYYLMVGEPLVIWPDMTGVIISRLLSSLYSAILLGAAFAYCWRQVRSSLLICALLLAVTPSVANVVGAVNPNGFEISAAIVFWVALMALFFPRSFDQPPDRKLLWLTFISGSILAVVRPFGPLFVGVIAAAVGLVAGWPKVRELARQKGIRLTALGLFIAGTAGAVWTVGAGMLDVTGPYTIYKGTSTLAILQRTLTTTSPDWARELIARFAGGVPAPDWAMYVWVMLGAALIVPALVFGRRRLVGVATALLMFTALLSVMLEVSAYQTSGPTQQGRYYLPLLVGLLFLAAVAPAVTRTFPERNSARLAVAVGLGTTFVHVIALALMISIFRNGRIPGIHLLSGPWHPAVGSITPLVVSALGGLLLVGLALLRVRRSSPEQPVT